MEIIRHEYIRDIISVSGFLISIFLLFIHIKNRKTQLRSYWLTRATHRSSFCELNYICSEQLSDSIILRLVFFNPGPIAAVIKSFSVYRESTPKNVLLKFLGISIWADLPNLRWWPTADPDKTDIKHVADEYQNLYVDDQRVIMVSIPGYIDRSRYKFEIKTNHGVQTLECAIDGTFSYFPHSFNQWFHEK